VRTLQLLTK